jgi:hypothetical protein
MATTYTSPVDKLLTLGKSESTAPYSWPNYLELGLGPQHIPELISMATDPVFRSLEADEKVIGVSLKLPLPLSPFSQVS